MAQLRKKIAEAEQKVARVTHDLNKEISELESLVESKIYREVLLLTFNNGRPSLTARFP